MHPALCILERYHLSWLRVRCFLPVLSLCSCCHRSTSSQTRRVRSGSSRKSVVECSVFCVCGVSRLHFACGLALRGRCWSASGEPFRFSGALWPLTLCGDCAYSAGCWPATCTRREFPEWNDFPQCLQRARLNTRFVAVDVGEQRTCRRCSRKPRLVKNRLQCGHCASFGDFLICSLQQFPAKQSGSLHH